jgi:hypothetical protein
VLSLAIPFLGGGLEQLQGSGVLLLLVGRSGGLDGLH